MEATTTSSSSSSSSCYINTTSLPHPKFKLCEFKTCFCITPRRKIRAFCVVNNNNNNNSVDKWEQMEVKFGQMMGEDPNLTRAKIMGRKSDPNVSYLEVEKSFYKNKGKSKIIQEVPFDVSFNGFNLVRPLPKKGHKFEVDTKPIISKPTQLVKKPVNTRGVVPNVILRKPMTFSEDDIGLKGSSSSSNMSMKPNLLLRMGSVQTKEIFTDMTLLLKKPEAVICNTNLEKEPEMSDKTKVEAATRKNFTDMTLIKKPPEPMSSYTNLESEQARSDKTKVEAATKKNFTDTRLLKKPGPMIGDTNLEKEQELANENKAEETYDSTVLTQRPQLKQVDINNKHRSSSNYITSMNLDVTNSSTDAHPDGGQSSSLSTDFGSDDLSVRGLRPSNVESAEEPSVPLIGKPNRLHQTARVIGNIRRETIAKPELESSATSTLIKEFEENDWRRAEDLIQTSGRDDVELVSASTRGFVVSLGSLIGFLPYRNLSPRWKFLAFESWLRGKGLDPSKYRQNLGIIGNNENLDETSLDLNRDQETGKVDPEISPDMGLDDLLRLYDQEKLIFLSSFIGQKIKVNVTLVDRKTRRLIFSLKPKEKEEMIDKKRTLMAKLSVGDVVKCQIKKITYFGIFVEVEGVSALIHQTEVSWDTTLDAASYYKVGQIVEAKVHQLDFSLRRIFLSLKEITPDPLTEALEAVIGDKDYLDGKLEPAQDDGEWVDVETLIKELQQFEGIKAVSKGRFFLSPGLAPTFQVYMASMFENEYKLLARAGNKVQEVIVQTSLGKEDMKSAILTCTSRVE